MKKNDDRLVSGYLRKKNGFYHTVINFYDPITKKQVLKSKSTKLLVEDKTKTKSKENLAEANSMLYDFRLEWTKKLSEKEEDFILFTDFLKIWLNSVKSTLEKNTYTGYRHIIENNVIPYFLDLNLGLKELKATHLQEFYNYHLNERGISANTVIHYHANIRKALQTALKQGLILNNQADLVEKPKKRQYIAKTLTPSEIHELLIIIKGSYIELPVYLAAFYGLRRSEALGLKWSSVDYENNCIVIENTIVEFSDGNKKMYENRERTKNKKSHRTLDLIPQLKELLLQIKEKQSKYILEFGNSYNKKYLDNICVNEMGDLIKPNYITKHFKSIIRKHNFKDIRFHDLRHSCATMLHNAGLDMKEIQQWLGHSTINTTMDTYTHLSNKNILKTGKILEKIAENKKTPLDSKDE